MDGDAPLDYATIQILPSQNRYEAFTCRGDVVEKLAVGVLEKLLPHLPGLKDLYAKGSNANFNLQPPHNLPSPAAWFTKSSLTRFLDIVNSMDLLDTAKSLQGEMSQLEEARKFHLSLYAQGHPDLSKNSESDTSNSVDMAPTSKFEVQNSSSDTSKNELLRAMDSRLAALRSEFVAAFNQAVGETCSYKEISHLAKFSETFGANDVKNLLYTFLELSRKSEASSSQDDEKSSSTRASMNDNITKTDGNNQAPKAVSSETPVKYAVSPAKAAQVERQSSTESEESSDSSDDNQTSAERSRPLIRSASPRRSASPMRRVQIGRTGSRRATALTIKSLSYFPARVSHRDVASDDSEEERTGHHKKPENDVRRMSVQDAIHLFESKQRDQITDIPKKNSLTNVSLGASKAVLRRWSSGMGESSQCQSNNASEDHLPEPPDNVTDSDVMRRSAEVNLDSDAKPGVSNINETVDVKSERLEESSCSPIDVQEVKDIVQEGEANERSKCSAEWSRQKEEELNQMFKKMMENQAVSSRKPQTNVKKNLAPEQRGGFYDHYKEKRDQKLRGENAGKRAEKEAKFKAMQKILDERKAEMASKNGNNICKKDSPRNSQKSVKNPQKPLKSSPQPAIPRKETTQPSTVKKAPSRTSSLPATRKSWPSAPSPRTTGTSPAKTSGGISSAGTTPTRWKPQPSQSGPQPTPKVESSQPQRRNVKATPTDKRGLTGVNEKQQQKLTKSSKTTKTKAAGAPKDSSSMVMKPSSHNKVTKKSSVVPLEAKPFLRKGSGVTSSAGSVNKMKSPSKLEASLKNTENSIDSQKSDVIVNDSILVNEHQDQDVSSLDHSVDAVQSETQVNSHQKSDAIDNVVELAPDADDHSKSIAGPSEREEESTISPTAWVEIEEQHDLLHQCDTNTGELTSSVSVAPVGSASPRVRHSLSQMLQEESSEADTTEWGNAENPPALVYQKDAPKGLKRLLKFARKSKGDANITGWSSPSVFSEGEDDTEESKAINKRNADNLLRKAALHAKNYENHLDAHELPSAQSGFSTFDVNKLHKGSVSAAASTTKGTRSFFSLSAFKR